MFDDINLLRWVFACLTMALLLGFFALMAARYSRRGVVGVSTHKKSLHNIEMLWLDARHKVVKIADGQKLHTVLITPNTALHLDTQAQNKAQKDD